MERKDILVETVIQKRTQIESRNQKIITTRIITRITKNRVIQGLVVFLNRDRSDRLK